MKKSILFTALAALLVATSCAGSTEQVAGQKKTAPKREGWDRGPLYGDVDSITILHYYPTEKFGEVVKDKIDYKESYKFNQKGDVIERANYNSDGSLKWKEIHKYDSQGNQIEEAHYNSDGSLGGKWLYKYDSQGKLIESDCKFDGLLDRKWLYKYDSQGNRVEWISYEGEIMKPTGMKVREIVYRK